MQVNKCLYTLDMSEVSEDVLHLADERLEILLVKIIV